MNTTEVKNVIPVKYKDKTNTSSKKTTEAAGKKNVSVKSGSVFATIDRKEGEKKWIWKVLSMRSKRR